MGGEPKATIQLRAELAYLQAEFSQLQAEVARLRVTIKECSDCERLRAALETIRRDYGKVCTEYELCTHPACESSAGAWFEADRALHDD
jgi:hypothetical protein